MAILKRFEVWLLLLVIVGAVWFVFQTPVDEESTDVPLADSPAETANGGTETPKTTTVAQTDPGEDPPAVPETNETPVNSGTPPESATKRFEIRSAKSVSEGGGSIVEFTVLGKVDQSLELVSPQVRLVAEDGEEFDRFFLPFDPAPILEPGEESGADLKYWVQGELKEKLWLEIDGDRVAVELEKQ